MPQELSPEFLDSITVLFQGLQTDPYADTTLSRIVKKEEQKPLSTTVKSTNTGYVYQDLDESKKEIRLLELFPNQYSATGDQTQVYCSLFIAGINDPPDFQALSYTWGNTTEIVDILLDGHPFPVTRNLKDALLALAPKNGVRLLWIDALCIDQSNIFERNEQVRRMRLIYERSSKVIAFLGERSDISEQAFNFFREVYLFLHDVQYIQNLLGQPEGRRSLKALIELFHRQYWARAWVVQEVVSAKEVELMCGSDTLGWHEMYMVQDVLRQGVYIPVLSEIAVQEGGLQEIVNELRTGGAKALRTSRREGLPTTCPLLETLLYHRDKEVTDSRDQIYALVGITKAGGDARFTIDYSRPLRQVYVDTATYIIMVEENLDVLFARSREVCSHRLPSWVPAWDCKGKQPYWMCGGRGVNFRASGASCAEAMISDEVLMARGLVLDVISDSPHTHDIDRADTFQGMFVFHEWREFLLKRLGTSLHYQEDFIKTLLYNDIAPFSNMSLPEVLREVIGSLAFLSEILCPGVTLDEQLIERAKVYGGSRSWAGHWLRIMTSAMYKRQFFISRRGYMGMGPWNLKAGDEIVILLGCTLPVILRPKDGMYTYLGEAYVDKYCHGLAMDELMEGKHTLQDLVIV